MTATLVGAGPMADRPGGRPTTGTHGSFGNRRELVLPGGSPFTTDTWVFFPAGDTYWKGGDHFGLGFGPTDTDLPRWSLYHCAAEDRFDSRSVCPYPRPSNRDLLRWSTSLVGPATATLLVESVGSCPDFYRRYFAERPDLRGRVGL